MQERAKPDDDNSIAGRELHHSTRFFFFFLFLALAKGCVLILFFYFFIGIHRPAVSLKKGTELVQ